MISVTKLGRKLTPREKILVEEDDGSISIRNVHTHIPDSKWLTVITDDPAILQCVDPKSAFVLEPDDVEWLI